MARITRVIALGALILGGLTATSATSASATNTSLTEGCTSSAGPSRLPIGNSDTVTVTITSNLCSFVINTQYPGSATITLNGNQVTTGSSLVQGDVLVVTAPANGAGFSTIDIIDPGTYQGISLTIEYGFPPLSASIVDNGDGSITVTYAGLVPGLRGGMVAFYAANETCPDVNFGDAPYFIPSADWNEDVVLAPSAAVITAGMDAVAGSQPGRPTEQILPGNYQACFYYDAANPPMYLTGAAVSLGTPAPTTTAAADPVTPSYTG